jgi:hypothetical protein
VGCEESDAALGRHSRALRSSGPELQLEKANPFSAEDCRLLIVIAVPAPCDDNQLRRFRRQDSEERGQVRTMSIDILATEIKLTRRIAFLRQ